MGVGKLRSSLFQRYKEKYYLFLYLIYTPLPSSPVASSEQGWNYPTHLPLSSKTVHSFELYVYPQSTC